MHIQLNPRLCRYLSPNYSDPLLPAARASLLIRKLWVLAILVALVSKYRAGMLHPRRRKRCAWFSNTPSRMTEETQSFASPAEAWLCPLWSSGFYGRGLPRSHPPALAGSNNTYGRESGSLWQLWRCWSWGPCTSPVWWVQNSSPHPAKLCCFDEQLRTAQNFILQRPSCLYYDHISR